MLNTNFGTEIEFTGITRSKAAKTVAEQLNGSVYRAGGCYDTYKITAPNGREWKVMFDSSITPRKKVNGNILTASDLYKCELVTPILKYQEDIKTLQEIVRQLRHKGAFVNGSCGIHIHLDGTGHNLTTLKNFIHIIYARNDLFYKALDINPARQQFCKKLDRSLVERIKTRKPTTLSQLEDIWYEGSWRSRTTHYNDSRYHFLNLHSFFHGHHTVELRGFNSTMHAGELRSYIVFALALNHQALTQRKASPKQVQSENDKFAMRTYLNRIGFIGDEFKNCREHLTKHLTGSAAWRYRSA